jgi:hypothetical protein
MNGHDVSPFYVAVSDFFYIIYSLYQELLWPFELITNLDPIPCIVPLEIFLHEIR